MANQITPKTEILLDKLLKNYEHYKSGANNLIVARTKVISTLLDLHFEVARTLKKESISDLLTKPAMTYDNRD